MNLRTCSRGEFAIGGRLIGPSHPPYIVAEISSNHCQDLNLARKLVEDCAAMGVDAIKLQTYLADSITLDSDRAEYRIKDGPWEGQRLYDLYESAMTPWNWTEELRQTAMDCGVHLFSTPFDPSAVDFLEALDVPAYKVASFELTYHQLLARIASTGKPVILSTGLASYGEIIEALDVLKENGAKQIALLKCTSSYPAEARDLNLALIPRMETEFDLPIGFSDHTVGTTAAVAAVALGACIVEKHVRDVGSSGSPDEAFSFLSTDLQHLVDACLYAYRSRGEPEYGPTESEKPALYFRRSIVASKDIAEGELFDESNLKIVRPMIGAEPREWDSIRGKSAPRALCRGEGVPSCRE